MNIYEAFETDSKAIEEGRWLEIEFQGAVVCEVRVRSASPELNPRLREAMTDHAIGLMKEKKSDELTVREALRDPELERKLFAQAVVSGWRDPQSKKGDTVQSKEGLALKCTPKNALKVFSDLPLLFQQVKNAAYRWETFRSAVVESSLGNSEAS